jgi:VanZ family protein
MWIDDISLRPLRVNHQFFRDRNILLGLGVILLFAFVFTLKIWEGYGWMIPAIILVGALGVLCRNTHFEEIASVLNMSAEVVKKIGHFIVFLAMGTTSSLWLYRRSTTRSRMGMSIYQAVYLFAALALFAALTEFLQLLTLDRTPRLTDYLIDLSGILLGVLLVFFTGKRSRIRPSKP